MLPCLIKRGKLILIGRNIDRAVFKQRDNLSNVVQPDNGRAIFF
jgi:hypothetical protein